MNCLTELIIISALVVFASVNSDQMGNNLDNSYSNVRCWSTRGQFPHLTYCDWFYNCWDGAVYEQKCPKGLVFNANIRACDYPNNVDCGPRVTSWELTSDKWNCPKPFGTFSDANNCSSFFICVGGTPVPQSCPAGLYFDPSSNVCDYSYNVNVLNCKVPRPPSDSFSCPVPNGHFAHHTDCDRFWTCDNFYPVLTLCPSGTLFDVRYSTCLGPDVVQVQCLSSIADGPVFMSLKLQSDAPLVAAASDNNFKNSTEIVFKRNSAANNVSTSI